MIDLKIDVLIALCSLPPVLYVSCFAHELGHAIMGHALGFVVTSFGMGIGRPFAVFSRAGTRIYFCPTKPFQGITFWLPPLVFPSRRTMIPALAAGIIAHCVLTIGSLALWRWIPWGGSVWLMACAVNAYLAVANLLPFQFRVGQAALRSDGSLILQVLRDQVISIPAANVIQTLQSFRVLWEAIGNHTMLRLYILSAAAAHTEMEDYERGEAILSESGPLAKSDIPTISAREALARGALWSGVGRLNEAAGALTAAEALFRSIGDDGGLLCAAMQRSWLRVLRHDAAGAAAELNALTSHRLVKRGSWVQEYVLALSIQVHAANSDALRAEQLVVHYEAMRRRRPSVRHDLQVYRAMARLRSQNEDWVGAEVAFRRAFDAINKLAASWPDALEQNRFLQRQSIFLEEARHCYEILNRAAEAERLVQPIMSADQVQQRLDAARRLHDCRLLWAGYSIMLVDVFCTLGIIGSRAFLRLEPWQPLYQGGVFLALGTFIAAVYLLFHFAIGRFIPSLRNCRGLLLLLVACSPWFMLLIFVFGLMI